MMSQLGVLGGLVMNNNYCARRGHWVLVEVICSKDIRII